MASRFGKYFILHVLIVILALGTALFVFSFFGGHELAVGNLILRTQTGTTYDLVAPAASARTASTVPAPSDAVASPRPRNVVLIIGDGMGVGMLSAGSALLKGPGGTLAMTETPFIGLMSTWATDNLAPDSASTATSMATGHKTSKGTIGLLADGRVVTNLFEAAHEKGLATGAVTTSALADATPAGFMAQAESRDDYGEIFDQVIASETEVLIGGDWALRPKARRNQRYVELVANAEKRGEEHGYAVIRDPDALSTATSPLLALFPARSGSRLQHGPPLAHSARQALELLSDQPEGFLLLVECEVIDEAGHKNDITLAMEGMRELDEAVSVILELSKNQGDTLVLVAADHDTGGLGLVGGDYALGQADVRWTHDYHNSNLVPVFAFGPGAEEFTGVFDNTELARKIAAALGLEPLPRLADSQAN